MANPIAIFFFFITLGKQRDTFPSICPWKCTYQKEQAGSIPTPEGLKQWLPVWLCIPGQIHNPSAGNAALALTFLAYEQWP